MSKTKCTNSDLNELLIIIDERIKVLPKIVSDIEIIKELQIKDHFRIKALESRSMSFRFISLLKSLFR